MLSKISFIVYALLLALALSSCSIKPVKNKREMRIHAKIYSLANGEIIEIATKIVGNGKTKIVKSSKTRNGETFRGEFVTISNSNSSQSHVTVNSQSGFASGTGFSRSSSNQQPGTGILIGDKGTVININ